MQHTNKTDKPKKNNVSNVSFRIRRRSAFVFFFFIFGIIFGETKQIVVALVATAFKALFSVTKTHIGLSRCQLYAGISITFSGISSFIYTTYQHIKSASHKGTHRKNASLECCYTNSLRYGMRKERKHFLPKYFPVSENNMQFV